MRLLMGAIVENVLQEQQSSANPTAHPASG